MIKNLSSKQEILLILKELFNHNIDICISILKLKSKIENKENLDYHKIRYEKIAKEHYYLHKNHIGKFSYIHNNELYVLKNDFKLDYYNYTGISYQIIELIHQLIKLKNDIYIRHAQGYKYWLKHDDKLYTLLAKKIKDSMNLINQYI